MHALGYQRGCNQRAQRASPRAARLTLTPRGVNSCLHTSFSHYFSEGLPFLSKGKLLRMGCLGPLYAIVIFIGVGERARWRAWAFPPCTPRIPFHGDGACTLVLHRGVELRPLCAWVHTPRPWLPPCRAGSVIRRPGGDAPNHRDPARLKG